MAVQRQREPQTKAVVTVTEMARMVGLSRARFYQLQEEGVFPPPVYDVQTRRPHYTEEQQKVCLEVRRRNWGVNDRPVFFYSTGPLANGRPPRIRKRSQQAGRGEPEELDPELVELVQTVEPRATAAQVRAAVRQLHPNRPPSPDDGQAVRAIALHVRRQNSGDSVGR